ncbi:hypothetical protein FPANT_5780 [Fusarium pseudoanthophilum]|uniref:Fungal N-terminal domain-containing protein n=1 Tax=Fusarium pseudoanthophilum TaxID=48495 RepID=A0A8H5UIF0_9HYPO|nr:hypothetical protein FPANT_5780 [Fusarium pseudoanthophilum]
MAEAIGLAASIAGLVQLTGSVFKLLTKFCKEAKDAPSKAQDLATQTRDLAGIFENLRLLASALEERDSNPALKPQHLESCQQTLNEINSKLDKALSDFDGSKSARRFVRRLKWPFSLQETKDLVADLANHRANLQLALSADSMDALIKSLAKQDEIHSMIERRISFETRVELNKRRKEVMNFFLRVKPQDYLDVSRELRHEATGSWLTSDDSTFERWKNGSNSKLWLSGIPGSGKTVLCGLVIETVLEQSDDMTAVCFAFCDYKNPDSCLPENILAALAVQLGLQGEEAFDLLEEYFDMLYPDDKLPTKPRLDDLVELVGCMSEVYEKVFVIVDGLDECGDQVARMTRCLKAIVDGSETVSSALFSRKEEEIREQLAEGFEHIEVSAHVKDLEDYTLAEVSKRKVLKSIERTNPDLYKDILHALVHGAQGMFRWVACQIDHICNLPNNKARKRALTELPPTLNETYDRVLQRVMQCPPETQTCVRRALQWTALGSPKMNIASLCEAVSFQQGMDAFEADDIIEPEVISRNCGCLLRKSLDGNYFEFAHFTVLEYLERTEVGDFRYSEEDAYRSFAQTSISYLLLPHFDRVPTIIDTVEEAYAKERNQKHPFYKFAVYTPLGIQRSTTCYPIHLRVMEEETVLELLKRLFDIHKTGNFRAWAHAVLSGGQNELSTMHQLSNGPLHFAVILLSPNLCQFLIDNGVDVNVVRDDATPLAMTIAALEDEGFLQEKMEDPHVMEQMARTIKVLLDNGADTAVVIEGHSCMAHAIDSLPGHYLLQFIRPTSAVPEDAVTAFSKFECKDKSDDLVLEAVLRLAVGEEACPQWKPLAPTALSFSRARGLNLPHVALNPTAYRYSDLEYRQALEIAAKFGLVDELSTLILDPRYGSAVVKPNDFELLSAAARSTSANSGKIFEILLGSGIDPHVCSDSGQHCLHISCESNNADVASLLLSRGVDPGSKDQNGQTSWHAACYSGHEKIISLLQKENKNVLKNLATIDKDGRTPFSAALHNSHTKLALVLLDFIPAEANYYVSKSSIMEDVAAIGSLELLTALRDKGIPNLTVSNAESTPMHHLSAACTPEFARSLAELYDAFCADRSGRFPFQMFFERWLRHNIPVKFNETIPLDPELLGILIPKNNEFTSAGKVTHTWQLVCAALAVDEICCDVDTFVPLECYYYFSRDLTTLFNHGVLSSYESTTNISGLVPLLGSLKNWTRDHFCSTSFVTLLSQVADSSNISVSLQAVNDSYHFFKLAMSRASPDVMAKLIDLGVDLHRRVPEDMSSNSTSLFEIACGEATIEPFKAILETVTSQSINTVGLTSQSPLELVVKGSSTDKISLIKALDDKGLVQSPITPTTPLIVEATKQNDLPLVKCLSDIGHDPFVVDVHGWGIPQWAANNYQLDILKWVVEKSSSPSQWQIAPASTYTSANEAKTQIFDDKVSLLHFVADVPDFLSYLFENHFFDINIRTAHGRTVLHYAAMRGSMACCLMLLDQGINISAEDKDGKLAVDYALETGFNDLASFLLASGSPLPRGQVAPTGDMIKDLTFNEGLQLARRREFEAAIMNGNLEQCKVAVSQGCSINQPLPSCRSCTPIFAAIRSRKPIIINWLLDEGTSTYSCVCKRHPTQNLFTHAVTVMEPSPYIEKLLSTALKSRSIMRAHLVDAICQNIGKRNLNVLKLMLGHFRDNIGEYYNAWKGNLSPALGGDSAEQFKSALLNYHNPFVFPHRTPLQVAAAIGNVEMVQFLIQQGADLNVVDKHHDTPLIIAASNNHVLVVRELLRHNAIVGISNMFGNTAMSLAVLMGHLDAVKLLAEERPSSLQYRNIDGSNLLHRASQESSSLATFKYLLSKGLGINQKSDDGVPMFAFPSLQGRYVDYLSQSRSLDEPLLSPAPNPDSILNNAIVFCTTGQVKRLYKSLPRHDASILLNMRGRSYGSPLCVAVFRNNAATTGLLLDLGADVNMIGCWFGTPLMCAISFGNLELVKLLVRRGASLDENGDMVSGLEKSLPYPSITRWLLVGRFQDQKMLGDKAFNGELSSTSLGRV